MSGGQIQLQHLFHRRWTIPVLAELHRARGSKLVTLVSRTGASRKAIQETLVDLMKLGLVMRNPGYGHPLRPEYLLTTWAMQSGAAFVALHDVLLEKGLLDAGLKKWSMPVLAAAAGVAGGVRFSALRTGLEGITDRALTLALKDLQQAGLVTRLVLDSYPPTTLYQATGEAGPVVAAIAGLLGEFPSPPAGTEGKARKRRASG